MSWVRLDDSFVEHPKIAQLTDREFRIWLTVLCYCGRQEDPTVDRLTMRSVRGLTPKFVAKLMALSLLDEGKNSYEIHNWTRYQPKDKTSAERQARYRSRRDKQAKTPRYTPVTKSVTETVTPDRYSDRDENVTPVPVPVPVPSPPRSSNPPVPVPVPEPHNPEDDITFTPTKPSTLHQRLKAELDQRSQSFQ